MKYYTTQRGKRTKFIPYRELTIVDRKRILYDLLTIGPKDTIYSWNITRQTLGHIKYHNKKILRKIEDNNFKRKAN